jgi:RHS repeat-associated protein
VERISGCCGRSEELYDPAGNLLGHLNGANGIWWEEYVPFDGRLLWYYTQATNVSRYFHVNALGSLGLANDQTGAPVEEMLHYPFGVRWQNTTGFGWDEKFARFPQRDEDLQMYEASFREYNPGLGRWMTPDPVGGDVTNPQSLNRYAYVLNNPTTLTDPLGLQGGNPADPCSDPAYYFSHAECGGPPPGDCEEYDLGSCSGNPFPPFGGYGGGGAPAPPGAPPAGQPPIRGDSLIHQYPCLSPGQLEELESELLATAGIALGGVTLNGPGGPVIGGAQNVFIGVRGGPPVVYVNPSVVAQAGPADVLEQARGWKKQIIVPDTHLPGPGNVVHILFNPGKANAQGQVGITAIDIHADIANQQDVWSGSHHFGSDVVWAWWSSLRQSGCAVKLF